MKSKRLALAMWRDNMYFAKLRALNKFSDNKVESNAKRFDDLLDKNIGMIAATKDKIKEIENDNE